MLVTAPSAPASGEQVWYDHGRAHHLFHQDQGGAGKEEGKKMVSAGLMATHQKKLDRYALLAALAERQTQDGMRTSAPMILPVS